MQDNRRAPKGHRQYAATIESADLRLSDGARFHLVLRGDGWAVNYDSDVVDGKLKPDKDGTRAITAMTSVCQAAKADSIRDLPGKVLFAAVENDTGSLHYLADAEGGPWHALAGALYYKRDRRAMSGTLVCAANGSAVAIAYNDPDHYEPDGSMVSVRLFQAGPQETVESLAFRAADWFANMCQGQDILATYLALPPALSFLCDTTLGRNVGAYVLDTELLANRSQTDPIVLRQTAAINALKELDKERDKKMDEDQPAGQDNEKTPTGRKDDGDLPIALRLDIFVNTDGDFRFDDSEPYLETESSFYDGAELELHQDRGSERYSFVLCAKGKANPCRWAARDLVEHLACSVRTHRSYVIPDVHAFLTSVLDDALWKDFSNSIGYGKSLSGNYDGSELRLTIMPLDGKDAEDARPIRNTIRAVELRDELNEIIEAHGDVYVFARHSASQAFGPDDDLRVESARYDPDANVVTIRAHN